MNQPSTKTAVIYSYDPLDRLIGTPSGKRFYQGARITTEIKDERTCCVFQHDTHVLAQHQQEQGVNTTTLLATDIQGSVIEGVTQERAITRSFNPFGYESLELMHGLLLGFNGASPDPLTGHYLLGQGYRAYNPTLMRFNSPDSSSPFEEGGFNAYAYCDNDPINYGDPSGHAKLFLIMRKLFNQRDVSSSLSRVKKAIGSVQKTTATTKKTAASLAKKANNKTPRPPTNTSTQATSAIKDIPVSRPASPRKQPKVPAPLQQTPSTRNKSPLAPIENHAALDEWLIRLTPSTTPPTAILPIYNLARTGQWGIELTTPPTSLSVSLIRL